MVEPLLHRWMGSGFVCRAHSSAQTSKTTYFKKWQRCGRPALIITESICPSSSVPRDGRRFTLVNTGSPSSLQTPWSLRKPLQLRVLRHRALFLLITSHGLPLAKQHEGKQGGDTHGGRGWRSKLIPHVPQEETFQAASAYSAGGVQQTLRAPRCTFPHFSPTHCCAPNPHGSI